MIDPANILLASARVACVAVVAAALFAAVRVKAAGVRYAFWRGVLALSLVLPLVPALSWGTMPAAQSHAIGLT